MSKKQIFRLVIDGTMLLMLFWIMAYSLTGNTLHEWSGIALTALFLVHIVLNRGWVGRIFKGRYSVRRTSGLVVNLLMFIALTTLVLASLPISSEVFPWFRLFADEMLPAQIHTLAGNWLFVLIAIHLGMQWSRVQLFLPIFSHRTTTIIRIAVVLIACYGVWAIWQRNLLPKLIMYYTFDIWRGETSIVRFLVDYIGIFTLFATMGYYLLRKRIAGKEKQIY